MEIPNIWKFPFIYGFRHFPLRQLGWWNSQYDGKVIQNSMVAVTTNQTLVIPQKPPVFAACFVKRLSIDRPSNPHSHWGEGMVGSQPCSELGDSRDSPESFLANFYDILWSWWLLHCLNYCDYLTIIILTPIVIDRYRSNGCWFMMLLVDILYTYFDALMPPSDCYNTIVPISSH